MSGNGSFGNQPKVAALGPLPGTATLPASGRAEFAGSLAKVPVSGVPVRVALTLPRRGEWTAPRPRPRAAARPVAAPRRPAPPPPWPPPADGGPCSGFYSAPKQ